MYTRAPCAVINHSATYTTSEPKSHAHIRHDNPLGHLLHARITRTIVISCNNVYSYRPNRMKSTRKYYNIKLKQYRFMIIILYTFTTRPRYIIILFGGCLLAVACSLWKPKIKSRQAAGQ